jgi:hypothetical protein
MSFDDTRVNGNEALVDPKVSLRPRDYPVIARSVAAARLGQLKLRGPISLSLFTSW